MLKFQLRICDEKAAYYIQRLVVVVLLLIESTRYLGTLRIEYALILVSNIFFIWKLFL